MADRGKVIRGLEYCVAPARKGWPYKPNIAEAGCEWYDCPYSDNCEDMLFDALELLKAQEPVLPKQVYSDSGYTWWYVCGVCGKPINPNSSFCHECGRAVKWDAAD